MKSIWLDNTNAPSFTALNGDRRADVVVIGGGIAGILTAYELKKRGVDSVLLEKERICSHTTGHTTGKITAGQGLIYHKLIERYGKNVAEGVFLANTRAVNDLCTLAGSFECGFEEKDNYVYSIVDREKIEREVGALLKIGASADFSERVDLPFSVAGAVRLRKQGQFNPVAFLYALASGLEIYENSFVKAVKGRRVICDSGSIEADQILIATHFPFINTRGLYSAKLYQSRSYVLAFKGAPLPDGMYVDEDEGGLSFRSYEEYLLLGGGGHRTGKNGGCFSTVREAKEKYYPEAEEKYAFAAQDCMSLDGIPYVGRYSPTLPNVYVATGFNKWGMCGGALAASLLCDEICGIKNEFSELFSPRRSLLHPQLLVNAAETVGGLLFPTTKRCAHLGCALHWNKAEHSWDCSCHGSRFDSRGRVIDNPSQKNAR